MLWYWKIKGWIAISFATPKNGIFSIISPFINGGFLEIKASGLSINQIFSQGFWGFAI